MGKDSQQVLQLRAPLTEEMSGGGLPDARLLARRQKLISALEQHPDKGFPVLNNGHPGYYRRAPQKPLQTLRR